MNAFVYGALVAALVSAIIFLQTGAPPLYYEPLLPGAATFILATLFFWRYPKILVNKMMEEVDRDLIFALKDISFQMASGVSLFDALYTVSRSGYGLVSIEFEYVVKDIAAGVAEDEALTRMTNRTESQYIKKTMWQLVSILRSGSSIQSAIGSIVDSLNQYQNEKIGQYINEMNLWVLVFLIVGVVVPSLGATILIILSSLGGVGIKETAFILLLIVCFAFEYVLIQYLKVRRPVVYM
jgi:flagellar protein FlaJ